METVAVPVDVDGIDVTALREEVRAVVGPGAGGRPAWC
jgi:hypothetical protein